jgi:nucleotide-binding universal stress UspA family protein
MPIICGVDFSEPSLQAARAAARLAASTGRSLRLVHAVQLPRADRSREATVDELHDVRRRLRALADGMRELGARIEVAVTYGEPDEALPDEARRLGGSLIVIGAFGRGRAERHGHAERIVPRSRIPVLVVRGAAPFASSTARSRPLRVLLGADASPSCDEALAFIRELASCGPLELIAVHVYSPTEQWQRLGLEGLRSYAPAEPDLVKALDGEFSRRFERALGTIPVRLRLEPHGGLIGEQLAAIADEERADLVVVGSHGRDRAERIVRGSVSYDLLQRASVSVACVPSKVQKRAAAAPPPATVLCATDFSAPADEAVALAYGLVATGGTVHLVHVTPREHGHVYDPRDVFLPADLTARPALMSLHERLCALEPAAAAARSVTTHVHLLEASDPARAICQAAERLDAALICLGRHGRGALVGALLGSVAQSVLAQTGRPTVLVQSPLR